MASLTSLGFGSFVWGERRDRNKITGGFCSRAQRGFRNEVASVARHRETSGRLWKDPVCTGGGALNLILHTRARRGSWPRPSFPECSFPFAATFKAASDLLVPPSPPPLLGPLASHIGTTTPHCARPLTLRRSTKEVNYGNPRFADEETEVQRGWVTCTEAPSKPAGRPGIKALGSCPP